MKKFIIIGTVIAILAGAGGGGYYFYSKSGKVVTPVSNIQPTRVPEEELAEWKDPAEFSFSYPKSISVNTHEEDEKNYSNLELTHADHPGKLLLLMKDSPYASLEAWAKTEKIQSPLESTLGELTAMKAFTGEKNEKIATVAIDGDYLYQLECFLDDRDYWNKVCSTVAGSFKITAPAAESPGAAASSTDDSYTSGASDDGGSYDEEETIE